MSSHVHTIRVRYGETDQMAVAHHGAYVDWLEEARIEWLRAKGVSYRDLEKQGILMPVLDVNIFYKRSLRFDDVVEMTTSAEAAGPSRVSFLTTIRLKGDDQICAQAKVSVAAVTLEGKATRVPQHIAKLLNESMT